MSCSFFFWLWHMITLCLAPLIFPQTVLVGHQQHSNKVSLKDTMKGLPTWQQQYATDSGTLRATFLRISATQNAAMAAFQLPTWQNSLTERATQGISQLFPSKCFMALLWFPWAKARDTTALLMGRLDKYTDMWWPPHATTGTGRQVSCAGLNWVVLRPEVGKRVRNWPSLLSLNSSIS